MRVLWLDDKLDPNKYIISEYTMPLLNEVAWVKSYDEFEKYLRTQTPDFVSFDYYLNDAYTGIDCVKLLIEHCFDNDIPIPVYYIHSADPIKRMKMDEMLTAATRLQLSR